MKVKVKLLSLVRLLATPWIAAYQAPLSHGIFQARVLEWGAIAFSEGSPRHSFKLSHFLSLFKGKEVWKDRYKGTV